MVSTSAEAELPSLLADLKETRTCLAVVVKGNKSLPTGVPSSLQGLVAEFADAIEEPTDCHLFGTYNMPSIWCLGRVRQTCPTIE